MNGPEVAPDVFNVPVGDLHVDEARFQARWSFGRKGTSGQLAELERFSREAGGVLSAWKDPADGKLYVVDGHNRLNLANRSEIGAVRVQLLDEPTAEAARLRGALINMQARHFTSVDVASVLRQTGWTASDLEERGVSLRERQNREGVALSRLHPTLFRRATCAQMPLALAVVIGRELPDHAQQLALLELLGSRAQEQLTESEVEQLIRFVRGSGQVRSEQQSLFGAQEIARSLAVERAQVAAVVRKRIVQDWKTFSFVTQKPRLERLAEEGSRINLDRSVELTAQAAQFAQLFDRLAHRVGPLANLIREAAEQVARCGAKPAEVAGGIYDRALATLRDTMPRHQEAKGAVTAAYLPGGKQAHLVLSSNGNGQQQTRCGRGYQGAARIETVGLDQVGNYTWCRACRAHPDSPLPL